MFNFFPPPFSSFSGVELCAPGVEVMNSAHGITLYQLNACFCPQAKKKINDIFREIETYVRETERYLTGVTPLEVRRKEILSDKLKQGCPRPSPPIFDISGSGSISASTLTEPDNKTAPVS